MTPGTVLLVGAPAACSLRWDQPNLVEDFTDPFTRFMGRRHAENATILTSVSPVGPVWRSIPLERQHLPTGLSQDHVYQDDYQAASFFTTSDVNSFIEEWSPPQAAQSQISNNESAVQVLSRFYEQSYAAHEAIPTSQLAPTPDHSTLYTSNASNSVSDFSSESPWQSFSSTKEIPSAGQLTRLKDIPNARYLSSIQPQTMTVNLIVGIISVPPARSIKTRRGDSVELIELLVGDETKSGFGINFWLPPSQRIESDLRSVIGGLRPQDVVLVKNVALSSFQDRVYAQSLRKNTTKAFLLCRDRIDRSDLRGCYSAAELASMDSPDAQVERTRRVREWVLEFVGGGLRNGKGKGRVGKMAKEILPEDTQ